MKKSHGGEREGAGRPKKSDTIQLSLRVPAYILNSLNVKLSIKERNKIIIDFLKIISK